MQQERRPRQESSCCRRRRSRGGRRARGDVRGSRRRHPGALAPGLVLVLSHFCDFATNTPTPPRVELALRSAVKWTDTRTLESFWRATEECWRATLHSRVSPRLSTALVSTNGVGGRKGGVMRDQCGGVLPKEALQNVTERCLVYTKDDRSLGIY